MPINETILKNRKYRQCIDNTPGNKRWNRYSFWTHASDVEFNDGQNLQNKLGSFKGVTTNENQTAGYAADVTLVKSIKNSLTQLITSVSNLVNSINSRLGGLSFYEDSNGKWIVGADSVPKKLGSGLEDMDKKAIYWFRARGTRFIGIKSEENATWAYVSSFLIDKHIPNYKNLTIGKDFLVMPNIISSTQENVTFDVNIPLSNMANISSPIDYNTVTTNNYADLKALLPNDIITIIKYDSDSNGIVMPDDARLYAKNRMTFALYYPTNGEVLVFTNQNFWVSYISVHLMT